MEMSGISENLGTPRLLIAISLQRWHLRHSGQHNPQQSTMTEGVSLCCQAQYSYTDTGSLDVLEPFFLS